MPVQHSTASPYLTPNPISLARGGGMRRLSTFTANMCMALSQNPQLMDSVQSSAPRVDWRRVFSIKFSKLNDESPKLIKAPRWCRAFHVLRRCAFLKSKSPQSEMDVDVQSHALRGLYFRESGPRNKVGRRGVTFRSPKGLQDLKQTELQQSIHLAKTGFEVLLWTVRLPQEFFASQIDDNSKLLRLLRENLSTILTCSEPYGEPYGGTSDKPSV